MLIFSVSFYLDQAFPGYIDTVAHHPAADVDDAIRLLSLYLEDLQAHRDEFPP